MKNGRKIVFVLAALLTLFPARISAAERTPAAGISAAREAQGTRQLHFEETEFWELAPSGRAVDAGGSGRRSYNGGVFNGCYGNQLEGMSRTVYNAMKEKYVDRVEAEDLEVQVSPEFTFDTMGTVNSLGQIVWDKERNAGFQEAMEDISYASQAAYDALVYDYPELFWLSRFSYGPQISISYTGGSYIGTISKIYVRPEELYAGASHEAAAFSQAVGDAVAVIRSSYPCSTRKQTLEAIHDYLCGKLVYRENLYAHSAAGVFLKGGAVVCEGYAKSFKILCGQFGIPSVLVVGDAGGPHMWNYVQMEDGKWYAVDVTWDDMTGTSTYFLIGSGTRIDGESFGMSRTLYTNFNNAAETQNFTYPILNGSAYADVTTGHTHIWRLLEEVKKPTCTEEGVVTNVCEICGEISSEREAALGHSFHGRNYIYNNDATVFADGTKIPVCDNGCGTQGQPVTDVGSRLKPTISLNAASLTLRVRQSTKGLKVSGLAAGDSVRRWTSSKPGIAAVKQSGKITAKKKGTAKITVELKSGLKKTVTVKVQTGAVQAKKITGVAKKLSLKKGAAALLKPTVAPFTCVQKVTYSSSNRKVVTVMSKGRLTAKKRGTATVTVKCGRVSVKCKVTVK